MAEQNCELRACLRYSADLNIQVVKIDFVEGYCGVGRTGRENWFW